MNKTIISLIIVIFILPIISATGHIQVIPNPVEQGSTISITLYPGNEAMSSIGTVYKKSGSSINYLIDFDCPYFKCDKTITKNYVLGEDLIGDYYMSVWDYELRDFVRTEFKIIKKTCYNDQLDIGETDIDCGGQKCNKCNLDKKCLIDFDCISNYCDYNKQCKEHTEIFNKNKEKYNDKEVFLVSDEDWKEVLKLVSLSTWKQEDGIKKFPVLIYHKEEDNYDIDSIVQFIKEYNTKHLTIFGETPNKLDKLLLDKDIGAGLDISDIIKTDFNDYFSYWNSYDEIIISSEDYENGILASLFASEKNIPLIFENEIDYGLIKNKKVNIIGEISIEKKENIEKIAESVIYYNKKELTEELTHLMNSSNVIVINTNDLNIENNEKFHTKISSDIKETYSKNSLASIFLASGKDEIILFLDLNESIEKNNCKKTPEIINNFNIANESIHDQVKELNISPEYLTIFASPNSIPDSLFNKCHKTGYQYRDSVDYLYANFNNEIINYGRIYGITISDSSSYVARSLFFDEIKNKDNSGLLIGHSFIRYSENMKKINDAINESGYESICYTGQKMDGCIKETKVPIKEYSNKDFIIFGDHGFSDEWYSTLKSKNTPIIDLSYVFSHACSTNNFWEGKNKLMSANMIRNGAISYQGSNGISVSDNSESIAIQKLTKENITLGELNKQLTEKLIHYKDSYELIGDPLLKPNLKEVDWKNISFIDENNKDIEIISGIDILEISSDKNIYNPNEEIKINFKIMNNENLEKNVKISYEIYSESGYISELNEKIINLKENEEKEIDFSMEVLETVPSEKYFAKVKIINSEGDIEKTTEFYVENTLKEFDIDLLVCEDIDCEYENKIFILNEKIYLDYETKDPINTDFILIYPDDSYHEISLPYSFIPNETGAYRLIINYSKSGYLDYYNEWEFVVTEDYFINMTEVCNLDNLCLLDENEQNCPQDCVNVNINDNRIININNGWSLVSIPLMISDSNINSIFSEYLDNVSVLYKDKEIWFSYPKLNDNKLEIINNKKAYFVKSDINLQLNISGNINQDEEIILDKGINFISYPCKYEKGIDEFFSSVIDDVDSINAIQDNKVLTYDPININFSEEFKLKPNSGYIVNMKNQNILKINC